MENPANSSNSLDQSKSLLFTSTQMNLVNLLLPPRYCASLIEQKTRSVFIT